MKKKLIIGLIVIVVLYIVKAIIFSSGFGGTFSDGYRMGMLSKFSVKGLIKSGEGQLLLGRESSPYTDEKKAQVNPWAFSATKKNWDKLKSLSGEYVVIEYKQPRIANTLILDTDSIVKDVYKTAREYPEKREFASKEPSKINTHSSGIRTGRLVKLSRKGVVMKTYELIIQLGNAGNQFEVMSINDSEMFEYAKSVLKSGKLAKFHYVELRVNASVRDSDYLVWKISFPEDL